MTAAKPLSDQKPKTKPLIIKNLITLKLVLFLFYGGLGCIFLFLPMHMLSIGLSRSEAQTISIVAPLVSILGPLIFGPLCDKLASGKGSTGTHLRITAAIAILLSALFYGILMCVPSLQRFEHQRPKATFGCDPDGAVLFQERIEEHKTCYYWEKAHVGPFVLTNCSYTCHMPAHFEKLYKPWVPSYTTVETSNESSDDYDLNDPSYAEPVEKSAERIRKQKQEEELLEPRVPYPHVCVDGIDGDAAHPKLCHAFTESTQKISLTGTLRAAINVENETHSADWCKYPLDGMHCNVPQPQIEYMERIRNTTTCEPMVECELYDPYGSANSILSATLLIGDPNETFWIYLILRCLADTFAIATIVILNTAILIATRETSTGRGDVGHQLVWGALGWAVFAPIVGALEPHTTDYCSPIIAYIVLAVLAAIVVLIAKEMPLSPPEWWWHTKSGMVAIPMANTRKYGPEIFGLTVVATLLGIAWSVIDSYEAWFIKDLMQDLSESSLLITLTITVGALAALPFLWYAERIVDYCGHTNLLISSFVFYAVRYLVMAQLNEAWFVLLMEAMEPLTLGLTWITIILNFRHIIPRRLTAVGQALPVFAHFCLGKAIGAASASIDIVDKQESLRLTYTDMSIFCIAVAVTYFVLYHCIFGPQCGAKPQPLPPGFIQGANPNTNGNSNGNYTPLRVYHDGHSRKGQFRY